MGWLVCCSQVAPVCSLTGSVSPGGAKGTCTQVWGGSKPLGTVSRAYRNVGDWTASHRGAPPFWVKGRMSHVSALPWRTGPACMSPSWMTQCVWALPSWMMGHVRVLPSWNWARWWAKGCLQVMCCVLLRWGHCTSWVLCATGSDREGSGSEGHGLGSKGDHLIYRVFARSKFQKAAGCPCESSDF